MLRALAFAATLAVVAVGYTTVRADQPPAHKRQAADLARELRDFATVVSNPNLSRALDELHNSADERKKAAGDTPGYLRAKGVSLPPGLNATFTDNNWSLRLCSSTTTKICVRYDSQSGWDLTIR